MFLLVSLRAEPTLSFATRWLNVALGNRLTRFMADTSYAVYRFHGFYILLAGGTLCSQGGFMPHRAFLRTGLLTTITLLGTYALAWVLHVTVEKPAIEAGKQIVKWIDSQHSVLFVRAGLRSEKSSV
jgi:peptidoglycan/LPS O-acetylase OafA/YrhL